MTVVGFLSVAPVKSGSMAEEIADAIEALDEHDVGYEITPMGTIIEAPTSDELFEAAAAAHRAVDADRVSTFLKVDDKRTTDRSAAAKVDSVEQALGRTANRPRPDRDGPTDR